ncbi:MAG: class I SAM-dependent methyltransferase [Candidatus Omnitrophota bacterium]
MAKKIITFLSVYIYNFLRYILENGFKKQEQIIQNILLNNNHIEPKILDVGCGTGTYASFFKANNYFGIEIDPAYIKYAKQHKNGNFLCANARYMPFKSNTFGAVYVIAIFHHLSASHITDILKELKRITLPRGLILIMDQSNIKINLGVDWLFQIIRYFDKGKFIRKPKENLDIVSMEPDLTITDEWTFRSGLITYQAMFIKKDG